MNSFNPSDIESAFIAKIATMGISASVYPNRPKSAIIAEDFVVVSLASSIKDLASYGECSLEVSLFAKDVNNVKNVKKLKFMYDTLVGRMPVFLGKYIIETTPQILADVPDDYGFHARILNFHLTLKIQ